MKQFQSKKLGRPTRFLERIVPQRWKNKIFPYIVRKTHLTKVALEPLAYKYSNDLKDISEKDIVWVNYPDEWGLGNFINLTPALQLLHEYLGYPIPVLFGRDYIRRCYLDCPFITILHEPLATKPLITRPPVDYYNNSPDYIYACNQIRKRFPVQSHVPHTYIDRAFEQKYNKILHNGILFLRGSTQNDPFYLSKKIPEDKYYKQYMNGNLLIFAGSKTDHQRSKGLFKQKMDYEFIDEDIRWVLGLISISKKIIANDCGLAHAAGAMNKNLTILWKNTILPKNATSGKNTSYKMCHDENY